MGMKDNNRRKHEMRQREKEKASRREKGMAHPCHEKKNFFGLVFFVSPSAVFSKMRFCSRNEL